MGDPFDLHRFVDAQQECYEGALAELRRGRKTSHWMWFIFPQIAGLGASPMTQHYAISCLDEARAYLRDPVLGERLRTCVEAVNAVVGRSALEIFGRPDDLKFRSSMTLFEQTNAGCDLFAKALDTYFGGQRDPLTLRILAAG